MQISEKNPLPGIVRIFTFWLLSLAISLGVTFLYVLTDEEISKFTTIMFFSGTCLALMPIADFYNRSQRAIVSSRLTSLIFSLIAYLGSFTVISQTDSIIIALENLCADVEVSQKFFWIFGMWLIFISALLLSFFFYVQNSLEVKKSLHIPTNIKTATPLPLGNLAVLSLITIALSVQCILAITFFSKEDNSEWLPFALLITVPHVLMAASMIQAYLQKTIDTSLYSKLGLWLVIILIMMASRNYILGVYNNSLPAHLVSIFSIFLYVLPNTLVVALPLIWWALRKQEAKDSESSSSFIEQLFDLPLPLIIGLLYVGFQGVLFVCNGAITQLVSPNMVSSELENSLPDLYAVGYQNSFFFFGMGMLLFSCICIFTTRKNPYHGITFCRIFCVLAAIAHGIFFITILTKNSILIVPSQFLIYEAALYCFTSIAGYAAFSVIQAILLLPHEKKEQYVASELVTKKEAITLEGEVLQKSDDSTTHSYDNEVISRDIDDNAMSGEEENNALLRRTENKVTLKASHDENTVHLAREQQDIEKKANDSQGEAATYNDSQQEATPYLDKVRPQLSKFLTLFIPQKGQPLPLFLFSLFCCAIIAKWFLPLFVKLLLFFSSSAENTHSPAHFFFAFSLLLSVPLLGLLFGRHNTRIRIFRRYLSFSLLFIIFFGSYAIIPGFALFTPEAMGIIAMLYYCENSTRCQAWFKKEDIPQSRNEKK